MKPSVYIENSIISYLTSEPSRDVVIAARQAVTRTWWSERRFEYELYVSRFVIAEASAEIERWRPSVLMLWPVSLKSR